MYVKRTNGLTNRCQKHRRVLHVPTAHLLQVPVSVCWLVGWLCVVVCALCDVCCVCVCVHAVMEEARARACHTLDACINMGSRGVVCSFVCTVLNTHTQHASYIPWLSHALVSELWGLSRIHPEN